MMRTVATASCSMVELAGLPSCAMQTIAPQDVCYRLVATKEGQRPSRRRMSFPKIISGRNGGASRTRLGWRQWRRTAGLPDPAACLCPRPSAYGPDCNTPHKKKEFAAGAIRQRSVQALATHGANQTLHVRILPRRSKRGRSVADAHCPHARLEGMSVGTVVVPHQVGGG